MKKIIILFCLSIIASFAFAGPVQELMELAEAAFAKGDFAKAKSYYLDITVLESATKTQIDDARYNINICQDRINELEYTTGYNRAISLFNERHFSQCKDICYGLLKFVKYNKKTNWLISQCNDSINARLLAQQVADSIQRQNQLRAEYNAIIEEATAYYDKRQYFDAITVCKRSFDHKYKPLGYDSIPAWYERCLQIYQAQQKGKAITPEFAIRLKNAIRIGDVNSGIARIVFRKNRVDSTIYVSTNGIVKVSKSGHMNDDFHCGYLGREYGNYGGIYDISGNFYSEHDIKLLHFLESGDYISIEGIYEYSDDMAPFGTYENKWGYINKEFKIVIKPQYDLVTAFHEGRAFVRRKDKWSIIDKNGNVILSKLYPAFHGSAYDGTTGYYRTVNNSYYSDGKIWVQTNKYHNILVDIDGSLLLDDDYDPYNILHHGSPLYEWVTYSDGLYIYKLNDKFGYMDSSGKIVIEPIYKLTYGFKEGLAAVCSNKWFFISTDGSVPFTGLYDSVDRDGFCDGLCAVEINGKWGYINHQGEFIIEPRFEEAHHFSEGFAVVQYDGQLGYVDKFGNTTFDYQ